MKINLGSGFNKLDGYINVDKYSIGNPDLIFDLEQAPWPFECCAVDEVYISHCLEHIGQAPEVFLSVIKELYRVCKDGAMIQVNVPHPRHDNFLNDPTHVRAITPEVLGLFSKESCIEWIKMRAANSPLALYLDVDFQIIKSTIVLDRKYADLLGSGGLNEKQISDLIKAENNVAAEYNITLRVIKSEIKSIEYAECLFSEARSLYIEGSIARALQLCEYALQVYPKHAESLHLSGVISCSNGLLNSAVSLIRSAIEINPNDVLARQNLASVFIKKGYLDSAKMEYDTALKIAPSNSDLHNELGALLFKIGNLEAALDHCVIATELDPGLAEAYYNCGNILQALNQYDVAQECYKKFEAICGERSKVSCQFALILKGQGKLKHALNEFDSAIRQDGEMLEAYLGRAEILKELSRPKAAINNYKKAIEVNSGCGEAYSGLAVLYRQLGQVELADHYFDLAVKNESNFIEETSIVAADLLQEKQYHSAVSAYTKVINSNSCDYSAFSNRAFAFDGLGFYEDALSDHEQAVKLNPRQAVLQFNVGYALIRVNRFEDAINIFQHLISINGDDVSSYINMGFAFENLKNFSVARSCYEKALKINPVSIEARLKVANLDLLLGDLINGFKGLECRWQKNAPKKFMEKSFAMPLWLGDASLEGKTILLHGEQGAGDMLQFCRYAPMVAKLAAKTILQVHPSLTEFLSQLDGIDQVIKLGEEAPPHDFQCPLLSLPLAFKSSLDTIPRSESYLLAGESKISYWNLRLGLKTRPRIGVAWHGDKNHLNDAIRSIPFSIFEGCFTEGLQFIKLTKDASFVDDIYRSSNVEVLAFDNEIYDFSDTAALCHLMDVVISVDTSIAHLAGALGKELWVLLPAFPDCRWFVDRADCPWYPTAKLYRQEKHGDWLSVIERVRLDLQTFQNHYVLAG